MVSSCTCGAATAVAAAAAVGANVTASVGVRAGVGSSFPLLFSCFPAGRLRHCRSFSIAPLRTAAAELLIQHNRTAAIHRRCTHSAHLLQSQRQRQFARIPIRRYFHSSGVASSPPSTSTTTTTTTTTIPAAPKSTDDHSKLKNGENSLLFQTSSSSLSTSPSALLAPSSLPSPLPSPSSSTPPWALMSDLHFQDRFSLGLDQTIDWIHSILSQHSIRHIFVLGDIVNTRSYLSLSSLSLSLRFFHALLNFPSAPFIHILVGNHDMYLKHSRKITSLDMFDVELLKNRIRVFREVELIEVDDVDERGEQIKRKVLMMPYHERQEQIVEHIDRISEEYFQKHQKHLDWSEVVGMGHLSILGARASGYSDPNLRVYTGHHGLNITQLSKLRRTFTGHFHSHQTLHAKSATTTDSSSLTSKIAPSALSPLITQDYTGPSPGSITYLGSPQQFHFGDVGDDARGILFYYPDQDRFEQKINPNGIQFVAVHMEQVMNDIKATVGVGAETEKAEAGEAAETKTKRRRSKKDASSSSPPPPPSSLASFVQNKCVMVRESASSTLYDYLMVRDRLIQLGARDVRRTKTQLLKPTESVRDRDEAGRALKQLVENREKRQEMSTGGEGEGDAAEQLEKYGDDLHEHDTKPDFTESRLTDFVSPYLHSLQLDEARRALYERVALEIMTSVDSSASSASSASSSSLFFASLRSLTLCNFLGIQGRIHIDFALLPAGVWFLEGLNGSGKSTLMEAISWCQFGKFLRSDMAADMAINERIGRDCRVILEFENGYKLERFRKCNDMGGSGSGIRVYKDNQYLEEMDAGESRTTQDKIESLLGINFDNFARTVVLGSSSGGAASFLSSTANQRRTIIEEVLGLNQFDALADFVKGKRKEKEKLIQENEIRIQEGKVGIEREKVRLKLSEKRKKDLEADLDRVRNDLHSASTRVSSLESEVTRVSDLHDSALTSLRLEHQAAVDQSGHVRHAEFIHELEKQTKLYRQQIEKKKQEAEEELDRAENGIKREIETQKSNQMSEEMEREFRESREHLIRQQQEEQENQRIRYALTHCPTCEQSLPDSKTITMVETKMNRTQQQQQSQQILIKQIEKEIKDKKLRVETAERQEQMWRNKKVQAEKARKEAQENLDAGLEKWKQKQIVAYVEKQNQIQDKNEEVMAASPEATIEELSIENPPSSLRLTVPSLLELAASLPPSLCSSVLSSLASISSRLSTLSSSPPAPLSLATSTLSSTRLSLVTLQERVNSFANQLTHLITEIQREEGELKKREDEVKSEEETKKEREKEMEVWEFWEAGFAKKKGSMRSFLLDRFIVELNQTVKSIMESLCEDDIDSTLFLTSSAASSSSPSRSFLDGSLDSELRMSPDYGKRSGGQRRRTDLSMFFGLLELSQSRSRYRSNYIILDEMFDTLDENGQEAVQRWISDRLVKSCKHVFVITHSQMASRAQQRIVARMTRRGTTYRVEEDEEEEEGNETTETKSNAIVHVLPNDIAEGDEILIKKPRARGGSRSRSTQRGSDEEEEGGEIKTTRRPKLKHLQP